VVRALDSIPAPGASPDTSAWGTPISVFTLGGLRVQAAPATAMGRESGPNSSESKPEMASAYLARHHIRALLALAGASARGIGRDELVEVLWPEANTAAGRNRLYHTLHLARQALSAAAWDDEWVTVRLGRVVLDERVWCDTRELDRSQEGDPAQLDAATLDMLLPLCRHDWMPGLDIGALGESVRARVRGAQARMLREAAVRLRELGDTPVLRAHLNDLIRLEATDESAHRELMQLDLARGRRHAVLRRYELCSRELTLQLGLRPTAQTSAIAACASRELLLAPQHPTNEAMALIGRVSLVRDLVTRLTPSAGVWNLTGRSGIGKSSVMHEVARQLAPTLADGALIVALGDLAPHDSAVAACVRALGLMMNEGSEDHELLSHALGRRDMLLVLDDLDAAADAQRLMALLPAVMRTRVVITSRAPLGSARAVVVPVPPLQVPAPDESLDQARQRAGYALFVMRCPLTSGEIDSLPWQRDVARLVNRLDGLPLAIELAAARAATMTPGEILDQIDSNLRSLGDAFLDQEPRHRSMQSALDWSVQLLSMPARSAYEAVSVFPASFARGDVPALMYALGLLDADVDALLDELLAAGLLARMPDGDRLRLLHLPRAHARARAAAQGHWPAIVETRLHEVYKRLGEQPVDFESPRYAARLEVVKGIEDDAIALLDHARNTDPARFLLMLMPLCESWRVRNVLSLVLQWAPQAIHVAQSLGDVSAELWFRANLTRSLSRGGCPAECERQSQLMLGLFGKVADPVLMAHAVSARARALRTVGEPGAGLVLLRQALDRVDSDPDRPGFWTLRVAMWELSDQLDGVTVDLTALRRRFEGSFFWLELLSAAFTCLVPDVNWTQHREIAEEIIAISKARQWPRSLLLGLWRRAACLMGVDDVSGAMRCYHDVYVLARSVGNEDLAANAMRMLTTLHLHSSDFGAARACLAAAVDCAQRSPLDVRSMSNPVFRAKVHAVSEQTEDAVRELLTVPPEWLDRVSRSDLIEWGEVGALVARRVGFVEDSTELANLMRSINGLDSLLPTIRRFHDRSFGSGPPYRRMSAEQIGSACARLRTGLRQLHSRLGGQTVSSS
jgi:predicted ATPase/DNA-binding SARP family transcriptional activator